MFLKNILKYWLKSLDVKNGDFLSSKRLWFLTFFFPSTTLCFIIQLFCSRTLKEKLAFQKAEEAPIKKKKKVEKAKAEIGDEY